MTEADDVEGAGTAVGGDAAVGAGTAIGGDAADPVDAAADLATSFAANWSLWDAWTAVHETGDFYDLAGFRSGGVRLRDYEIAAVGDGLRIVSLVELPALDRAVDFVVETEPGSGTYRLAPGTAGQLPLMCFLRASRPFA